MAIRSCGRNFARRPKWSKIEYSGRDILFSAIRKETALSVIFKLLSLISTSEIFNIRFEDKERSKFEAYMPEGIVIDETMTGCVENRRSWSSDKEK